MSAEGTASGYEEAKRAWEEAKLSPLWESAVAFREGPSAQAPLHWQWSTLRPLVDRAIELVSPKDVERRVLLSVLPRVPWSARRLERLSVWVPLARRWAQPEQPRGRRRRAAWLPSPARRSAGTDAEKRSRTW